jgi:hypothetical protein
MPFGPEAKAMLQNLVEKQPLRILVYNVDMYGRLVADVHCKKGFVQVRNVLLSRVFHLSALEQLYFMMVLAICYVFQCPLGDSFEEWSMLALCWI